MLFQGTLVNVAAVLVGSAVGVLLGRKISAALQELLLGALGLSSLLIGVNLAIKTHNMPLVIASLILGGVVGHLLRIEQLLESFGEWLKRLVAPVAGARPRRRRTPKASEPLGEGSREGSPGPRFTAADASPAEGAGFSVGKAFVTASLIFCVGPLTIMGSLQDGAAGDPTLLYTKSALDGPCSMVLTAGMGFGVVFSAVSVLTVQGSLTLVGRFFQDFLTGPIQTEVLAAGGLLTIAIGLELLRIKKLPTANFLPALLFAGVGAWLLGG